MFSSYRTWINCTTLCFINDWRCILLRTVSSSVASVGCTTLCSFNDRLEVYPLTYCEQSSSKCWLQEAASVLAAHPSIVYVSCSPSIYIQLLYKTKLSAAGQVTSSINDANIFYFCSYQYWLQSTDEIINEGNLKRCRHLSIFEYSKEALQGYRLQNILNLI